MIIVENKTGVTSFTERFQCSAQKIAIKANSAQLSDLKGCFVTLVVVDANGQQKVITPRTSLGDLIEIASSNVGMTYVKENYSSGTLSSVDVLATIELSNMGSVDLCGGYGQIQIDNAVSTTSFNLYGIEASELTKMIIDYRPIYCDANQYKETDISDAYAIAIPQANLVELQLQYRNGRTCIFKPNELKAIVNEVNEIAEVIENANNSGATKTITGGVNLYCLGVSNCVSMRVQYTAGSTFYKVSNIVLQ